LYAAVISNYPSLQSTITAIIPARIPAASPSARIAIGKAAELGVTVADPLAEAEVEIKLELETEELETAPGVVDEVEGVDADAEMEEDGVPVAVGVVIEVTGVDVVNTEDEFKSDVDAVLSVTVSDEVL
jgi:hypothetical protein